jgi:hypothetical protein
VYARTLLVASFAVFLYLFAGPGPAHAGHSVAMSPAFVEASVKRGTTFTQSFTISNGTTSRLRFQTSVSDYGNDEKNNRVVGRAGTLPRSASAWVQFSPSEVVVEPGTSAEVAVIVTVPSTAEGGRYAMCFFEGEPADAPSQSSTASATIRVRLGAPLLLSVAGASKYDVAVLGGEVSPPTATSELLADLDVINRGDAHARFAGMFAILDGNGRLAGRGRIEEKRFFPGQHDTYRVRWAGELAPGHYTLIVTLKYDRAGADPGSLLHELRFDVEPQR